VSTYEVNSEAIIAARAGVRASIASISSEVVAMNGRLAELQSTWRGGAASAFVGTMEQWRSAQREVEAALEQINRSLASAGDTYSEVERLNMARFTAR
jgi:WXG100 family type VII secretion target